ncbi:MAG: M3 family oligoendopeptidase [Spirochaetaceae bacterium]|jgi:pepF/M3 family oligoendopeptidase|nr:M3 family oligoendopeptidase [Spirochaetaceae bacterium]
MSANAPIWDLSSVYKSFDCAEYKRDCEILTERIAALEAMLGALPDSLAAGIDDDAAGKALLNTLDAWEAAGDYAENLSAYADAVYTSNTQDHRAGAEINNIETLRLPFGKATVIFRGVLAANKGRVMRLAEHDSRIKPYSFFLSEAIEKAAFQMESGLEDLANDLCRSGGDAWGRLHEALTSTASAVLEDGERRTVTELRSLANCGYRTLRRSAYNAELEVWKAIEIPMAAALNGVKGCAITVDTRRGWSSQLQKSAFQSRIEEKTLHSLISVIENALPLFHRYLALKARMLGIEKCAFFDLFAPVGEIDEKQWEWDETTAFIAECFEDFEPEMAAFARRIYASGWVDAEIRKGKIGGAYCTDFPLVKESRILCNFDGAFNSALTIAHETGHAWHHELIKDLPRALSHYPMTLAETASLFAETLVFEAAVKDASPSGKLRLIEGSVKDSCQTIVDILSRFYFEKELFARRAVRELPAAELCSMMLDAQKKTYGEALDGEKLHPYMWAVKIHYYNPSLPFYNYPYAFGHLFALSLYARGREEKSFARVYRSLLEATGCCSAEDLALRAGFDISSEDFWRQGINIIAERVSSIERGLA